jgi:hypothetical protein
MRVNLPVTGIERNPPKAESIFSSGDANDNRLDGLGTDRHDHVGARSDDERKEF